MEAQRVIVENLPKPKRWWQKYTLLISVIIAAFALLISLYSAHLSRQEFIVANRPYVYVSNRKNDNGTMDINTVLLRCLNAPAQITNKKFCYVVVKTKENGEEEVAKTIPWILSTTLNILYPSDKTDNQVSCEYDFKKEILADPNNILRRKVRVDYKEFSSDRTYYFEGNWNYNKKYGVWESGDMFAN